LSDSDSGSPVG